MEQIEKTRTQRSAFVDNHQIVNVDDHISIMIMTVNDFEAMGDMMSSDEMKAWDADNGFVDVVYTYGGNDGVACYTRQDLALCFLDNVMGHRHHLVHGRPKHCFNLACLNKSL